MLRWSSTEAGGVAEPDALTAAIASGDGDAGLPFGGELVRFAEAIGGFDDDALAVARDALAGAAGETFMVDAAAVAANFEMMTRVADGTGARFPQDATGSRAALATSLGIADLTSARNGRDGRDGPR